MCPRRKAHRIQRSFLGLFLVRLVLVRPWSWRMPRVDGAGTVSRRRAESSSPNRRSPMPASTGRHGFRRSHRSCSRSSDSISPTPCARDSSGSSSSWPTPRGCRGCSCSCLAPMSLKSRRTPRRPRSPHSDRRRSPRWSPRWPMPTICRTPAIEGALRAIGLNNAEAVCTPLMSIIQRRSGRYSWLMYRSAIRVIGDVRCQGARTLLESYSRDLAAGSLKTFDPATDDWAPMSPEVAQLLKADLDRALSDAT